MAYVSIVRYSQSLVFFLVGILLDAISKSSNSAFCLIKAINIMAINGKKAPAIKVEVIPNV